MGCSPTKASQVASVNNNNTTQNVGSQGPDRKGVEQNGPDREMNGGSIRFQSNRKKKVPVVPKKSAEWSPKHNQPLVESNDASEDEVFLPDDRVCRTEVLTLNDECKERVQGSDDLASKPQTNQLSSPLLHGHRVISRSQSDFFRMLDEKIAMGHSLSSLGSVT